MLTVAQLKVEIIMFFKNNSVHDRAKSITQFPVGKGFWKSHCHPALPSHRQQLGHSIVASQ